MKKISFILSGAVLCGALMAAPMTANAATAAEAAELARQYGFSEEMIQQGWNEYNAHPELYPPEVIDSYIAILKQSGNTIVTNVPYDPNAQVSTETTAAPEQGGEASTETTKPAETIAVEMPDGSTIDRISKEQFINLSYDDKLKYLSTFTEEQQTAIIKNLSPEEYKSMLKQLPTDQKLSIIGDVTEITNSLGLSINVDEITDDNIILSMKNQDGELVAVSSAKDRVEDTGYDRRGIFAAVCALIITGIAGMTVLVKKCFEKEEL